MTESIRVTSGPADTGAVGAAPEAPIRITAWRDDVVTEHVDIAAIPSLLADARTLLWMDVAAVHHEGR